MTLGNNPQPLTRRQLRELARGQQATDAAAGPEKAIPARRVVAPQTHGGDKPDMTSFTELIEQVEAPSETANASAFAPRPKSTGSKGSSSKVSPFKRPPVSDDARTPERTLTRRELREMMAAKSADPADRAAQADTSVKVGRADVELDPAQQVLHPSVPRMPLLAHDKDSRGDEAETKEPFDQLISRGASTSVTTSNTLILPSIPQQPGVSPMSATGEVLITGSIELPRSLGSTGAHPNRFDSPEVDRMLDQVDESAPTSSVAPVSASRAVSTHTSTRGVMAPPKKHIVSLPMVLAITAGVLLVGVVTLFAAGYLFQIF